MNRLKKKAANLIMEKGLGMVNPAKPLTKKQDAKLMAKIKQELKKGFQKQDHDTEI